jgi:uncharacterized protein YcnI
MNSIIARSLFGRALCLGAVALASGAHAHIALENQTASAGGSYKASFKVGHGCDASSTRQIVVDIPAGVRGARPMPKSGWMLEVRREKLAKPYTSHGRSVEDDVTRITWTAKTPDDMLSNAHYDEFVLVAQMPREAGRIYWPVRQLCEQGQRDWVEVPKPGQKLSDLKSPAIPLDIQPAGGNAGHRH